MGRNQLIVQFAFHEGADFDALIHIEDALIQAFEQNRCAVVDGHDLGEGKFNIFLIPRDSWAPVIDRVKAFLKLKGVLSEAVIAKRLKNSGQYVVVWPENYDSAFVL